MRFPTYPLILGLPVLLAASTPNRTYRGEAYDLESRQLSYVEIQEERGVRDRPLELHTLYLNPRGQSIVERNLDFSRSATRPDYALRDLRNGYEEGAAIHGDSVRIFFRASGKSPLREKRIRIPEPFVIDGGFNGFLKENWDKLVQGRRMRFYFVAPSRLDYYAFSVRGVSNPSSVKETEQTFAIEPDNAFIRIFVKPILVTYDPSSRRMLRYQGISNISDAYGKSFKVRLIYPEAGP
jgi:hypothetical protein